MLKVGAGDGNRETTLEALCVFKAGIHQLPYVWHSFLNPTA
jgi:hypothetical protein